MALTDGLVSYYKFDETSGTTATDAHGATNGTLTGGTTVNTTSLPSGNVGTCYEFDGVNDWVSIPNTNTFVGAAFTYSMWVKMDAVGNLYDNTLITQTGTSSYQDFSFYWISDTQMRIDMPTGSGTGVHIWSQATSVDTWYLITVTHDATYDTVYLNGSQVQQFASGTNAMANPTVVRIGTTTFGTRFFDGKIDEVGFWSRALTSTEVGELYNSGNGFSYPFVTGWAGKIQGISPSKVQSIAKADISKIQGVA